MIEDGVMITKLYRKVFSSCRNEAPTANKVCNVKNRNSKDKGWLGS